ncbi:leguminosin group486 secreted peptide [Medicago truncatula]|nr:leguminosin group486 secreted peptide [Medicago truncatula]
MSLLTQKFLLLWVLTLLSAHDVFAAHSDSIFWRTQHVNVTNYLLDNLDLTLHCKSKDDDLGVHLLHHGDNVRWGFGLNFFGETLFFCSFQWNDELHRFDIYRSDRDYGVCRSCNWYIFQSGPCRFNGDRSDVCFSWDNN